MSVLGYWETSLPSLAMLRRMTLKEVDFATFAARHKPALEASPAKNFALLMPLHRMAVDTNARERARLWSAGGGSACSLLHNGTLVVGDIDIADCHGLAGQVEAEAIRRLLGPEASIECLIKKFNGSGLEHSEPMPQIVMELNREPNSRLSQGHARVATEDDLKTIVRWLAAFRAEALPDAPALKGDPLETRSRQLIGDNAIVIWEDKGKDVSMAAVVTRLSQCDAISMVYTPPEWRNLGYAGAAVTHLSKQIISAGKRACLYVDARNPISTRCYEHVGYVAVNSHLEVMRKIRN